MLISYRHNFLFVHIAKTGGTSIRAALRKYRWGWPYTPVMAMCSLASQMTRPRHKLGIKFPRHAKAIAAREMLPAEVYDNLFKFVVVRNPWDLQVSSYHHLRREHPQVVSRVDSFEAFLDLKFGEDRDYNFLLDISREIQSDYVVGLHGELIVDFIARYESLETDFAEACRRIGIEQPPLPHHRRAEGRTHYRDYYTARTRDLVAHHYAADIERFGYRF